MTDKPEVERVDLITELRNAVEAARYRRAVQETHVSPEVANQVLFFFGHGGYPAGSFVESLLHTISRGDEFNQARLALAFPDYVAAMRLVTHTARGLDDLTELAKP